MSHESQNWHCCRICDGARTDAAGRFRAGGGGGYKPQAPAQVERGPGDFDRTRDKAVDPAYQQDRDRDQDRTHVPSGEERARIEAEHRKEIQTRDEKQGVDLDSEVQEAE